MGASQHRWSTKKVAIDVPKSLSNLAACILDNCVVSQCVTCLAYVSLSGNFAHRFNHAVESWCVESSGLVSVRKCVRKLISKLCTLKSAAKPLEPIHLGAVLPNKTWWSVRYQMVKHFFSLETALTQIKDLDLFLLTPAQRGALHCALYYLERTSRYIAQYARERIVAQ